MSLKEIRASQVKGVGPKRAKVLADVGIETIFDLVYRRPRKYIDRSRVVSIADSSIGQEVTLIANVVAMQFVRGRKSRFILSVTDNNGSLKCIWFNGASYMQKNFSVGDELALRGTVQVFSGEKQIVI